MSRNKPLINTGSKVAAGVCLIMVGTFLYRTSYKPYFIKSARKRAEEDANILYEKYNEKEGKLDEMIVN